MSAAVKTVGERVSGGRPGGLRAFAAAAVIGAVTAVATCKALRK